MNQELQTRELEAFHKYQYDTGKEFAGRILGDSIAM